MLTKQNIDDMRTCSDHHCEKCSLFVKEKTCAEQIAVGVDEIMRLAKIGKATEKALANNEYCIASYKGNHVHAVKTVDELLEWANEEVEDR